MRVNKTITNDYVESHHYETSGHSDGYFLLVREHFSFVIDAGFLFVLLRVNWWIAQFCRAILGAAQRAHPVRGKGSAHLEPKHRRYEPSFSLT